ncbi:bifunctional aspartate kinase/homoserine dehydrogenase II [Agarivorans sp. 1_MG-2023]|uniref:bifunctional aspartate kinase/homoserine dehydrogenase II n=1 Tax=Agarivorans sp. 1_MG-2023 TaxID=3062634 RepID=UPI0026E3106D|nr:bifunctional aspartate kinase/homoserine dehydrogenase II [Agarivorans sp. 1_MG-2023]MDO6765675.1 bifunctional aspartate kinase/homoserine dehydrogenase II [Agarivorans sp. 1_MG-2023]
MSVNRHVHKFGGSSLADAGCFKRVANIVAQHSQAQDLIVVSAAGKTTNRLINIIELAQQADDATAEALQALIEFQGKLANELLSKLTAQSLVQALDTEHRYIASILEGELDTFNTNEVLSFGERWSARLLAALLSESDCQAEWLDSREFFKAELSAQPQVDVSQSTPLLAKCLAAKPACRVVVTGFICSDSQGRTVTLGRNGSDYSATELAALADAISTTIWSDVAGIYSADPRLVKNAHLLENLALKEAAELSRIGSSVLHARTLEPLARSKQKVSLRCSYAPNDGQTLIHRKGIKNNTAKIVTSVDDIVLLELTFSQDFSNNATALLEALAKSHLAPATRHKHSETGSLRMAYTRELVDEALSRIDQLAEQFQLKQVERSEGFCLVALVGAGVCDNPQQCYQFFQQLAEQPLEFIHSSADKLSLCAVVRKITLEPLLKELHTNLFKQKTKLGLVVFGKGNIGSQWLSLFAKQQSQLQQQYGLELSLAGVFSSQAGHLDFAGLHADEVLSIEADVPLIWPELFDKLSRHPYDELVVVDITASEALSAYYQEFARRGFHLITANKHAGASEQANYAALTKAFADHSCHWLSNATVGAGLPVQSSIQQLRQAGDNIESISGIFSGTLSWLFQQYDGSLAFSELLADALNQGLTEPDPREDLSGKDVQRKLLILAREAGLELELSDISLESLVPEDLAHLDLEAFLDAMSELDEPMLQAFNDAKRQGKVIRFLAKVDAKGQAEVGLAAIDAQHPFANLKPCDNVFAIESQWYKQNQLVIQGPGAGREVTAGAIQADLVNLCQLMS